jgi:adenylosuccinate lyase
VPYLIERYSPPAIRAVWSDQHRFELWLRIEILACEAWATLGRIPPSALPKIRKASFDADRIAEVEAKVGHDVVAFLTVVNESIGQPEARYVHLGMTSQDLNDTATAVQLRDSARLIIADLATVRDAAAVLAVSHRRTLMAGRTHGVVAEPTTFGFKVAGWVAELDRAQARLERAAEEFGDAVLPGKLNGAVGNYNAHLAAYPDVDWEALAQRVVARLGMEFNAYTTQIEPHDRLAALFDALSRANTILLDFNRDVWGYVSLGYFRQKVSEGEVGSSTMPHKVNPIDFENSEGNLGLANALLRHLAEKLPVSRWQRDLSDSTVMRNVGVAFGYALLGYLSCRQGLGRLAVDPARLAADLDANWEVLAEPIQTVMRRYGIDNPYEQLKALTRGKGGITRETLHAFVDALALPPEAKQRLKALTPSSYIGKAAELARRV